MKKKPMYTDLETEPDYTVRLKCIKCGEFEVVSGHEADFHEVDNTNFVCNDCTNYHFNPLIINRLYGLK